MNDLQNGSKKVNVPYYKSFNCDQSLIKKKTSVVYSKAEGHWSDSMSTQAVKAVTVVV